MSNRILKITGLVGFGLFLSLLVAAGDLSAASKSSEANKSQGVKITVDGGNKGPKTSGGTTAVQKTKKPSKQARACGSSNKSCENRCNKNSSSSKDSCLGGCTTAYSNCLDQALGRQ